MRLDLKARAGERAVEKKRRQSASAAKVASVRDHRARRRKEPGRRAPVCCLPWNRGSKKEFWAGKLSKALSLHGVFWSYIMRGGATAMIKSIYKGAESANNHESKREKGYPPSE